MGVVSKAKFDARRVANKNAPRTGRTMSSNVATSNVDDFLVNFPIQLRQRVLTKGVRKAGKTVVTASRQKVTRSKDTGTRKGWSKKVQAQRAAATQDLWKSIATKIKQYNHVVYGAVGPRRPWGNHGWIYEHGATIYLWGKEAFSLRGRPFLRPAAMETKPKQQAAIIDTLKTEWQKV